MVSELLHYKAPYGTGVTWSFLYCVGAHVPRKTVDTRNTTAATNHCFNRYLEDPKRLMRVQ